MTTNLIKLIGFIKENSGGEEICLYPSQLSKLGLSERETDGLIDELSGAGAVRHKRIAFAPDKIQSTSPKQASFSSVKSGAYNVPVFLLRIDEKRLGEILNENLKSSFDNKKAVILIGKKTVSLPPHKNEHCFCRVAFKHPVDEPVDWSEIYEEMTGDDVFEDKDKAKTKKRMVYDAMEAVNGKVKKQTGSVLFEWNEKTVRRLC